MAILSAYDLGIAALWLICLAIIFRACRPTNVTRKPVARLPADSNRRRAGIGVRTLVNRGIPGLS
jgi:hypothetical protein